MAGYIGGSGSGCGLPVAALTIKAVASLGTATASPFSTAAAT